MSRLSSLAVGRLKEPGMYADGGGLYLQISRSGTKSWIFRFAMEGREREMGLGSLHTIGLSDARLLATKARKLKLKGSTRSRPVRLSGKPSGSTTPAP
jgi:hypothetical protein